MLAFETGPTETPPALSRRKVCATVLSLAATAPMLASCGVAKERVQLTASGDQHTNTVDNADVNRSLSDLEAEHGVSISLAVYDHKEGELFLHRGDVWSYEASIVKVPIALTMLRRAVFEKRELDSTEKELVRASLSYSDNGSTTEIYRRIGASGATADGEASTQSLNKTYELLGAIKTRSQGTWGNNQTWAEDQVKIMRFIVEDIEWINDSDAEFVLDTMSPQDQSQTWGVGAQLNQEIQGSTVQQVAVKNGWLQDDSGAWHINSVGVVRTEDNTFSVAMLSKGFTDQNLGYEVASRAVQVYFDQAG